MKLISNMAQRPQQMRQGGEGVNDGGTCGQKGVKCVGSVAVGGCWQRVYFLKIKMPSLWVLKCCSPPSAVCSYYRCFFFLFRLFVLQLHFWLCVLSWLLLNIFVYTYYMPFMCLFLECLFGFIFMISCIFKCLKVYFNFCLPSCISLSLVLFLLLKLFLCLMNK